MSSGTVMIVAGTAGTELFTPPSFFGVGPRIWVWLDYPVLVGGGWRFLALSADGVTPVTPLTGPLEPGGPLRDYYGILGEQLGRRGWSVLGVALDWRQTLDRDAVRLQTAILSASATGPVHLVCHSRGGLVARAALALLSAAGQLGRVGRVVGLGVPHQGSWAAAALLAGWDDLARSLRHLIYSIELSVLGVGLAGDLQAAITSWPTAYALLPSPTASGVSPGQLATLYNAALWGAAGLPISAAWLSAAQAAWQTLAPSPPSVPWLDVVGLGLPTADQLVSSRPPTSPADLSWSLDGDGTVLRRWATQPGRPTLTTPTRHSALPYDGRVISAIDTYLKGGLNEGGAIEGSILY